MCECTVVHLLYIIIKASINSWKNRSICNMAQALCRPPPLDNTNSVRVGTTDFNLVRDYINSTHLIVMLSFPSIAYIKLHNIQFIHLHRYMIMHISRIHIYPVTNIYVITCMQTSHTTSARRKDLRIYKP